MKPEELTDPNPDFTQMFWFLLDFLARMSGGLAPHTPNTRLTSPGDRECWANWGAG